MEADDADEKVFGQISRHPREKPTIFRRHLTLNDPDVIGIEEKHWDYSCVRASALWELRISRPSRRTSSNSGKSFSDPETFSSQFRGDFASRRRFSSASSRSTRESRSSRGGC